MTSTPTCPDLHHIAHQLRVHLVRHTGGAKGYYHHPTRTISTRRGMSIAQYRSTLAHELGHAYYGDTPTGHGHFNQRQEQRADHFAADLLIPRDCFIDAYRWCQGDLRELADELEVTRHLLGVRVANYGDGLPLSPLDA